MLWRGSFTQKMVLIAIHNFFMESSQIIQHSTRGIWYPKSVDREATARINLISLFTLSFLSTNTASCGGKPPPQGRTKCSRVPAVFAAQQCAAFLLPISPAPAGSFP